MSNVRAQFQKQKANIPYIICVFFFRTNILFERFKFREGSSCSNRYNLAITQKC